MSDDNIKSSGCYFVLNGPEKYYPNIPYSESYVMISFAPYESEIIRQSSDNAKTAYMIAKTVVKDSCFEMQGFTGNENKLKLNTYILKTCLLHCIEAFTAKADKTSDRGLSVEALRSRFEQLDVQFWLETLMKCYLDFFLQDFCPCYFMPSFGIPIRPGRYIKYNHLKLYENSEFVKNNIINVYAVVYYLYRCFSSDKNDYQITVQPYRNDFNREALLSKLSALALKNSQTISGSNDTSSESNLPSFVEANEDSNCEEISESKTDEVVYQRK